MPGESAKRGNVAVQWADRIARSLRPAIRSVPDGFYDSFAFTSTGNNLTHPITLGLLTRILWKLPHVAAVGVDVRLNLGAGTKFQPDLVAFDRERQPLLAVDYESPNSSDARVPWKDVDAYAAWSRACASRVPYVIVTTLPDVSAPRWELRYTHGDRWNAAFFGRREQVCENPYRFWYRYYAQEFRGRDLSCIALVNIFGRRVERVLPTRKSRRA